MTPDCTRLCDACSGLGVVASCPCHGAAACPAARDQPCEDCGGEGRIPLDCDAYTPATASTGGCHEGAADRCPGCGEALCGRHLAWHRAECGAPDAEPATETP